MYSEFGVRVLWVNKE